MQKTQLPVQQQLCSRCIWFLRGARCDRHPCKSTLEFEVQNTCFIESNLSWKNVVRMRIKHNNTRWDFWHPQEETKCSQGKMLIFIAIECKICSKCFRVDNSFVSHALIYVAVPRCNFNYCQDNKNPIRGESFNLRACESYRVSYQNKGCMLTNTRMYDCLRPCESYRMTYQDKGRMLIWHTNVRLFTSKLGCK